MIEAIICWILACVIFAILFYWEQVAIGRIEKQKEREASMGKTGF